MKLFKYILIYFLIIILLFQFQRIEYQNHKILEKQKLISETNLHNDSLYKILDGLPLGSPLDTIIIDDKFGIRKHPILKIWRRHWGIDLRGTYRDTVYATGKGKIKKAEHIIGYGNHIIIKHKAGYESLYAHMNKLFVEEGQKINKGDAIGTVGSSGLASGPHLHYELARHNKRTNPQEYLNIYIK